MTQAVSESTVPAVRRSPSWVEVDLAAVRHNVAALRTLIAPAQVIAVVKADAYGHGAVPVARAAQQAGAAALAVASLQEGLELRQAGLTGPLLLLHAGRPEEAGEAVAHHLTQTLCRLEVAGALSAAAAPDRPARVHLKLDTGMGRLGLRPEEVADFARAAFSLPGLELTGVFSHLATAEEPDTTYARLQFARYQQGLAELDLSPGVRHLANSAGALAFPEMRFDAVRTGLIVYGLDPIAGQEILPLRPALAWKTRVAFLRTLPAGCCISYGRTYTTPGERLVGVLPLGYADGFPRHISNRASVLVRGVRCPTLGTVCMDHVVVDLTPAGDVRVGEEVVLIGPQGADRITANEVAEWAGTVVHEIPTRLGPRVRRCHLHQDPASDGEHQPRGDLP